MSGFKSYCASSLSAVIALAVIACSGGPGDAIGSESSAASATVNLCVGQAANTFHCLDDTRFELCTGVGTGFVIESCPPGLCATRHPPSRNPCIGAARATQIDGVPPTPPGQIDDNGSGNAGGTSNTGGSSTGGSSTGGSSTGGGSTGGSSTGGSSTGGSSTGGSSTGGGSTGSNNGTCVGGPKFDPAGEKNVGNGVGRQFIGGQCLSAADCASGCCAFPCGICSGPGAQFQAGKQGCGFGG
jgi:hypothetical protein